MTHGLPVTCTNPTYRETTSMFIKRFPHGLETPPKQSMGIYYFEIVGEGTVTKHYLVDGQTKKLTYTRAIHTPTLNANLVSVSAFDRAGLSVTFEGGHAVIRKKDGTAVLNARCVRRMYVVDKAKRLGYLEPLLR